VFAGQDLGVEAKSIGLRHGTTTLVDAGSAGAHLYPAFRDGYLRQAADRVFAFLNIASIGLTSISSRASSRTSRTRTSRSACAASTRTATRASA
jgi:dihydroorotase